MAAPRFEHFTFTDAAFVGAEARLGYRLWSDAGDTVDFTERFTLPAAPDDPDHPAIQQALRDLHIVAGVSYWKAACPADIRFEGVPTPDPEAAAFWTELYTFGLGEFFYTNDLPPKIQFPSDPDAPIARPQAPVPTTPGRLLLLVGGGKDSAVAREVLRHAGADVTLLSVGSPHWIRESVKAMGDRHLVIRRKLDPALFALNDAGAHNGHVPISAIIAAVTRLVAMIGGYEAVVSANERSASSGNVQWRGMEVNHQWSKGLRFERLWQAHAGRVVGGPGYFSLLRPLTELRIGQGFARHPRYFDRVTSCNANFRIRPQDPPARWCGHCPKCLFVSLILAPHLDDSEMMRIFGGNFLAEEGNRPLLMELMGLAAHKPFECVGTPEEVAAALWSLHQQGRMAGTPAMALFIDHVLPTLSDPAALYAAESAADPEDAMPARWREALDAYLRAG
ncbi:MAG: hypothetical protein ACI8S6_002111 [Myxococcota bacterium]|jgi:hypothetical protein